MFAIRTLADLHAASTASASAGMTRRGALRLSVLGGAGLVLGFRLPASAQAATGDAAEGLALPFLRIGSDGLVTVLSKHLDKGQGIATGLATLVAEELDADPAQMRAEFAPADARLYANLLFGVQGTGGSTGIANSFKQYREAGAAARQMLIAAAAAAWAVPAAEISIQAGRILHAGSGRSEGFAAFAAAAAAQAVPAAVTAKEPRDWVLIGKGMARVDQVAKIQGHGAGLYGMDVALPGMLVAVLQQPPAFGGTVKSVDDAAARQMPGVVEVLQIPQGVAVLGRDFWAAIQGRAALKVEWDLSKAETRSSAQIAADFRGLLDKPGLTARKDGDVEAALAGAAQVIEASYSFPYLAHAPMEPITVTIQATADGGVELLTGSQLQTVDQAVVAGVLGLTPDKVAIRTLWAGGSFGRRAIANGHYVAEAAALHKALAAKLGAGQPVPPIKLIYAREDDLAGGYYRPLFEYRVRMGLDAAGQPVALHSRAAGQAILIGTPFEAVMVKDGIDATSVEGLTDLPYRIPAVQVEIHNAVAGVPVLWWRSVGHTHTAYVAESLIDEAARLAGQDPVAYRLALLPEGDRRRAVLQKAAEMAGWTGAAAADGRFRGVAVHKSFESYVAEIVEIAPVEGGAWRAERVWAAVDCGIAVNPDVIRAQVEGGIGYGLGAVLRNQVVLGDGGVVETRNFDSYLPLRLSDMPKVEVAILESAHEPTGIGEPGVPPIGPAFANALAAATGRVPRRLPLSEDGLV